MAPKNETVASKPTTNRGGRPDLSGLSKREKFVQLANSRANKVKAAITNLSRLGNATEYEYTEADIAKIEAALVSATSACGKRLKDGLTGKTPATIAETIIE